MDLELPNLGQDLHLDVLILRRDLELDLQSLGQDLD